MDEFSSLGGFGQMPKPNQTMEDEKQVSSFQSSPIVSELQKDTVTKQNRMVDLGRNDLGSVDNLVKEPLQSGDAISDASLKFNHMSENMGDGGFLSVDNQMDKPVLNSNVISDNVFPENQEKSVDNVSGRCEKAGFNENAELRFDSHVSVDNQINKPTQINHVISDVLSEGVDVSLKYEHGSENQGEVTCESGRFDVAGSNENCEVKNALEGVDANLRYEQPELKEDTYLEAQLDNSKLEQNENSKEDKIDSSLVKQVENTQSDVLKSQEENLLVVVLGIPADWEKSRRGRKPKAALIKTESPQQLSVSGTARALRSRSKENYEDEEPSADVVTRKGSTGRRGRKKGKEVDGKSSDEFSKMKKHLRYLLHRIKYEQNLLDAYSSEGWRGQSIEKLRPEKELQRAKADINRSKLKIRDLFKHLESISAQGKFPESLFDSDGLIDSEDIFCAKCGSKDLYPGNDILLCDGICERGFHQNCLNPPLPTEKIPPGDEGWLCPACDCKVDCYNVLNDSHGTKLIIEDNWEKVFPEAVATTSGTELDDLMGLPSDDSDDEYNPDGPDDDANTEENKPSSDDSGSDDSDSSDFSSASEDLGAIGGAHQNIGLPSDDSEDDDFDPNAANVHEEGVKLGSSGSDFSSASEDLGEAIDDGDTLDLGGPPLGLEVEQDLGGESSIVTGKRCAERLDYKKLYDETFGNAASDSSDDEEWTDMAPTRKRKNSTEKISSVSTSVVATCHSDTPRRRGRPKKANQLGANGGSPAQPEGSSQKTNSDGSSRRRGPYSKFGEAVTKRLYESFKENQYPDRETKEKLANEVGLTPLRVDKWFGHTRWTLHHHPSRLEASMNRVVSKSNTPQSLASKGVETTITNDTGALPGSGNTDTRAKKTYTSKIDEQL